MEERHNARLHPALTNDAIYEEISTVAHEDDASHIGSMRTIVGPSKTLS